MMLWTVDRGGALHRPGLNHKLVKLISLGVVPQSLLKYLTLRVTSMYKTHTEPAIVQPKPLTTFCTAWLQRPPTLASPIITFTRVRITTASSPYADILWPPVDYRV